MEELELRKIIEGSISESIDSIRYLYDQSALIYSISKKIYHSISDGNKILVFGNGGSAADAQHIAAELVGRFKLERKGLAAIALTTDTSILTAIGNDYGFENIFERQVDALAEKGDVLLGISTSGNSENVIRAFKIGREIGTYNISFTGKDGGRIRKEKLSDLDLNVGSNNTPKVQEAHEVAYHTICDLIERQFVEDNQNGKK